jgi:hypothetical protein
MAVRFYAVLRLRPRAGALLPGGVQGEKLRLLKCPGCSAAVADVRVALEPAVANLLEFDRVIRGLAAVSEAILPARFGAVSETVAMLKADIAERAGVLNAALDNVSGRVQMTLRFPAGPAPIKETRRAEAGARRGRGAEYLQARAIASSPPALTKLRKAVADFVRDERIEPRSDQSTVYHLIDRDDVAAYRARLDGLPGARLSGPFPPYAFVPGIDHAVLPGHDDEKAKSSRAISARPRARR